MPERRSGLATAGTRRTRALAAFAAYPIQTTMAAVGARDSANAITALAHQLVLRFRCRLLAEGGRAAGRSCLPVLLRAGGSLPGRSGV
jgi:hypothetical protein